MLAIAKIVKPQGIKGEIKAVPLTNVLAVFKLVKTCFIDGKEYKVLRLNFRQNFLYFTLEGVTTRNDAETLRGKSISIEKDLLEQATGDYEFLLDDLIGMVLYDTDGNLVGQIMDVENYGATDNLLIEHDGRTIQVPFLKEVFLIDGDRLVVDKKKFDEVAI